MYSSLLSNGLAQLWDSPSPAVVQLEPEHPTTCSTSKQQQQQQQQRQRSRKQQQYRSFLSFDVSPDSFRASVASTSSGITIPNKRRLVLSNVDLDGEPEEEYHVQLFSSSSSRRSFESAVTVPQPTSKRNHHHHRSRISSSYFSISSSTSNTASSSTQQPSAASSSSSNTTQPQPLTRRRSLPSAKPVPLCKPPSIPHPHSTIDSRSSIRRRSGSKQIRSSFASSWLPRIPVSTFSPSLPHFGLNFSSSETEGGDGDGDTKERLDEGYESSSSSSSDSQRTRSSLSSMGKLSRRSISSASTVTLYTPVPMARFTQVTTTSGEVSVFDDDDDDDDEDGMSRFSGKASSVGLPPSPSPTKSLPSSVTISRSSTVSTNYRRAKRSDALAALEGRGRLKLPSFGMHHLRSHSSPLSTKTKGQQAKEKENVGMGMGSGGGGGGARKTVPFAPSSFVSFSEEDDDDDEEDEEEDERWPSSVGVSKAWRKSDRKSDSRPRRRENFIDLK